MRLGDRCAAAAGKRLRSTMATKEAITKSDRVVPPGATPVRAPHLLDDKRSTPGRRIPLRSRTTAGLRFRRKRSTSRAMPLDRALRADSSRARLHLGVPSLQDPCTFRLLPEFLMIERDQLQVVDPRRTGG